jgi:hypothetical protein
MKKIMGLAIGLAFSAQSYAATTGVLELSGVVAPSFSIVVNDAASATTLDIVGGASGLLVATVNETGNAAYKISASSTNGGKLKSGATEVAYQISYDGGSLVTPPLAASPLQVKTGAAGTDTSNVNLTFSGLAAAPAGTYTDNVTFEIAAQ